MIFTIALNYLISSSENRSGYKNVYVYFKNAKSINKDGFIKCKSIDDVVNGILEKKFPFYNMMLVFSNSSGSDSQLIPVTCAIKGMILKESDNDYKANLAVFNVCELQEIENYFRRGYRCDTFPRAKNSDQLMDELSSHVEVVLTKVFNSDYK